MLLVPGLLAFIVGKVRGGSVKNLGSLSLKKVPLFFVALLLQFLARFSLLDQWSLFLIVSSYLVLLFSLWSNIHLPGMLLVLVGTLLNALVIAVNGGQMPVAVELAGLAPKPEILATLQGKHTILSPTTRLPLLADIIAVQIPFLSAYRFYSIGDLFQMAGLFQLVQGGMLYPHEKDQQRFQEREKGRHKNQIAGQH